MKDFRGLQGLHLLIKTKLWAQVLVAMALGVSVGLALAPSGDGPFALNPEAAESLGEWLKLPGSIFLNMIQMVVIPLIATSIILGIATAGDPDFLRKTAVRLVPYFVCTTMIAVLIGASLAGTVKPGAFVDQAALTTSADAADVAPTIAEPAEPESAAVQLADLIPANPAEATLNRNMLQIVVATIFVAVAVSTLSGAKTKPFRDLLQVTQDIALKIVSWAMLLAPLAVFGLIADFILQVGFSGLVGMSVYVGVVILGLALLVGVYMAIVAILAGRDVRGFLGAILDAQVLAFSTSSSAATMPVSMKIAQEDLGVRPAIAKFIIPLGATINMDGTALYQVVAAMFVAQVYGITLPPDVLAALMVTVVGASIGSPSTPGVGIVILATILQSIGVPASGVAILLGVDRILDMCRTSVNVTGDLTACVVMDKWIGVEHLPEGEMPEDVAAAPAE